MVSEDNGLRSEEPSYLQVIVFSEFHKSENKS